MTANAQPLPLPVRLMNLAGKGASLIGLQPVKLGLESLLETARANTGLTDFGGEEFRQPLALLLESLENQANLSQMGRIVARSDLLRTLENRLGMVELFRSHPEITEQPVERPIFVVGAPRTGTTIFHDLLAMDPNNRVPLSWETCYPLPPPETATFKTDPRIARVQSDLDRVDQLLPEFKKMHPMGAERAQECVAMTTHDFASMIYQTQFDVSNYDRWVLDHDMRSALQWHRRFLQVLQWKAPGKRWALKSPQHLWHIQHTHREYPDALFVQTHRDPVRVLTSMTSLVFVLRRLSSDKVSITDIAEYYAMALGKAFDNTVQYRRSGKLPESQVVDLYFQDFIKDEIGTVRRAYEHFGLELGDQAAAAMQSFLDDNPADKHGKHFYSFADTGIDEERVREIFHDYQTYFDVPVEAV
jgi:PIN domain nuclease of toxin-antitoxin system